MLESLWSAPASIKWIEFYSIITELSARNQAKGIGITDSVNAFTSSKATHRTNRFASRFPIRSQYSISFFSFLKRPAYVVTAIHRAFRLAKNISIRKIFPLHQFTDEFLVKERLHHALCLCRNSLIEIAKSNHCQSSLY